MVLGSIMSGGGTQSRRTKDFMNLQKLLVLTAFGALLGLGCGSSDVELADDGGVIGIDANPNAADANKDNPLGIDASPQVGGPCEPGNAQCNNCEDDDLDGFTDGDDLECTGALDDDEDSFATGIAGDNNDAIKQDCFFDGNSGGGDGCDFHICCLLEPFVDCCEGTQTPEADGCLKLTGPKYDPNSCVASQACIDNCAPLSPPGCDCLGCCTICEGTDCRDIFTNPAVYENETCDGLTDPTEGQCCDSDNLGACYSCTKVAECGGAVCDDNPDDCILCPGQTEDDLPAACTAQDCGGAATCNVSADCDGNDYCQNGCCFHVIQ